MKTFATLFILFSLSISANAQLISRFTWESNPAGNAVYGPNALSISSYATVSTGGAKGTKGLNPGNGSNDINLVLDGSYFNIPAIDISVDFRREESQATFFYRGSYLSFGMNGGSLAASFQLVNGASFTTINSGSVYAVPDDHNFHTYRFSYDNNTGVAKIYADAVLVYTYNGVAGTALYYAGAGNVTIGKDMDATGRNVAILDNLVIQKYANALLPLKLLSFAADAKNNYAAIEWNTTEELNVTSFVIERSADGAAFSPIKTIAASNAYTTTNNYKFTDSLPFSPVSYYRLKMINEGGSFTYSTIKSITVINTTKALVTAYPNPTVDYVTIKMTNAIAGKYNYTVSSIAGQVIIAASAQLTNGYNQVKIDLTRTTVKGIVVIHLTNTQNNTTETFTIVKS